MLHEALPLCVRAFVTRHTFPLGVVLHGWSQVLRHALRGAKGYVCNDTEVRYSKW